MPVTTTYPGVYIEEISSGVRTIAGVATSITAFIGRAKRGPVNEAKTINNFGDYERIFGGLDLNSSMSFAVRDFYVNGGSKAVIIRLYHADTSEGADPAKTQLTVGNVAMEAAYEGSWGAYLRAEVDTAVSEEVATNLGLTKGDLFNLTVRDAGPGGDTERYLNLSFKDSLRRVDKVLDAESTLVRWRGDYPDDAPPAPKAEKDAVTVAEKALQDKKEADPDADTTAEEAAVAAAKEALAASDGARLDVNDFTGDSTKGLYALEPIDLFNLLCLPPYLADGNVDKSLVAKATTYCEKRRAMLLVDPRADWRDKDKAVAGINAGVGAVSKNAAVFFPRLKQTNPLRENRMEEFVPCGAVAGVMARTDTQRGVWKAPAGIEATLRGVPELSVKLTDAENGELNPLGVNCLRTFPIIGRVVWGARTLRGADVLADEYKYIPVRRLALFIEESLFRGTKWVVFEPNDEPLWAQIRLNVGAFMHNLFRQGAFQGTTPKEAYFVKCDKETTTQNDIDRGIVNIVVGFAPLKPAEFVIIKLQQIAGELEV
jgi:phage tail sheath protein FI